MKALIYTPDGDGKAKIEEIPAALAEPGEDGARSAGGNGGRRRRRADAGILRRRHAARRRSEEGTARSGSRETDFSGAAEFRAAQYRQRRDSEFPGGDLSLARGSRESSRRTRRPDHQGRNRRAEGRGLRAGVDFRVQDAGRSVCGAHQLFQGDVRRAEERRDAQELQPRHAGAPAARAGDAGQDGRRGQRSARGRYWARSPN